ncbi:lipid kinase [Nocardioides sp. CFH 31398]|uniref:lipid kinase n=1 Tax=Nocardioides sp. CFH 31398 TaxID=2919579 RepID=UPI001F060E71|nr:lipid kinase [Nocardioides sp. CFH 31398]MCH1866098.1 lipid kinase [Nocardioides sp. CFH 31398]
MQPSRPLAPRKSRAVLVVNGASRRGAAAAATAERLMRAQGWRDLEVRRLEGGADLPATLGAAVATAPDLLVVGGGDGSLSCGAGAVAGTEVVLGVLPLGTANDFARTLQVPHDLPSAVATLTEGHVVDIDLGRVGLVPYLNVASIGLSVGVTEKLSPRLKKRLGPLAYPVATLAAYRAHEPFSARLEFPDGDHETLELHDLLQVAVGNGRHYGGGNAVSPTASLDDHLLDVYAIVRGRLRDHVSIARLLKDGSFVEHERVHHVATRRLRVVTEPDLGVNLDGEIAARTPADFTVERNAVHVVVPVHSAAAVLDGPGPSATGTHS